MNQSSEEPDDKCLVAIKIKLLWWKGKVGSFKADAVRRLHWIISDTMVHYYILQAHIWMTISLCQLYSFRTLADPPLASALSVFRVRHWSVSLSWEEKKRWKQQVWEYFESKLVEFLMNWLPRLHINGASLMAFQEFCNKSWHWFTAGRGVLVAFRFCKVWCSALKQGWGESCWL